MEVNMSGESSDDSAPSIDESSSDEINHEVPSPTTETGSDESSEGEVPSPTIDETNSTRTDVNELGPTHYMRTQSPDVILLSGESSDEQDVPSPSADETSSESSDDDIPPSDVTCLRWDKKCIYRRRSLHDVAIQVGEVGNMEDENESQEVTSWTIADESFFTLDRDVEDETVHSPEINITPPAKRARSDEVGPSNEQSGCLEAPFIGTNGPKLIVQQFEIDSGNGNETISQPRRRPSTNIIIIFNPTDIGTIRSCSCEPRRMIDESTQVDVQSESSDEGIGRSPSDESSSDESSGDEIPASDENEGHVGRSQPVASEPFFSLGEGVEAETEKPSEMNKSCLGKRVRSEEFEPSNENAGKKGRSRPFADEPFFTVDDDIETETEGNGEMNISPPAKRARLEDFEPSSEKTEGNESRNTSHHVRSSDEILPSDENGEPSSTSDEGTETETEDGDPNSSDPVIVPCFHERPPSE